jgi:hypothetical protein
MNPLMIGPVLEIGKALIDRFAPEDKAKRQAIDAEFFRMAAEGELKQVIAQLEINAREAAHPSVWVAGWRPFIGWVCGIALSWAFIIAPTVQWAAALAGRETPLPELDTATIFQLVLAMLGLSGWRSLDKIKGVGTKEVRKATLP